MGGPSSPNETGAVHWNPVSRTLHRIALGAVAAVALTLGQARAETAADWAAQAGDHYPPKALEALYELGNMGVSARDYRGAMALGLMRYNAEVRNAAARALRRTGSGAGEAVYPLVAEASVYARKNAVLGFQAMGGEGVAPLRLLLVRDPDPDIRLWAALTLSKMGDPAIAAVPDLRGALEDPVDRVRVAAKSALSLLSCAKPLMPTLSEPRCFAAQQN